MGFNSGFKGLKKRNSQATGSPADGDNTRYIAEVTLEDGARGKKYLYLYARLHYAWFEIFVAVFLEIPSSWI